MKLSAAVLAAAALAGTSNAYRITVYSADNYQGTEKAWTTSGSHSVGFTVKSWIWSSPTGDGCCIAFCKGSTVGRVTTTAVFFGFLIFGRGLTCGFSFPAERRPVLRQRQQVCF